jgi:hypothetical protein
VGRRARVTTAAIVAMSTMLGPMLTSGASAPRSVVQAVPTPGTNDAVASNKPFGRWGETFGDHTVNAAMIDRLVHHADVVALKGDSYRLTDRDLGRPHTDNTDRHQTQPEGVNFQPTPGVNIQPPLTKNARAKAQTSTAVGGGGGTPAGARRAGVVGGV